MEDMMLNEIKKELNFKEKIIVSIFKKTFTKTCNLVRIKIINKILKNF